MLTVFVDSERCIGCRQCEFACAVEHSRSRDPARAAFEQPLPRSRIHVDVGPRPGAALPNRCRHCNPAPCLQACPTGAISRDPMFDIVLVDQSTCIACAMCAMVCPFDVVDFYPYDDTARAAATKCDSCVSRLRDGIEPACVEVCKVDALVYGEINEITADRRAQLSAAPTAATETEPEIPNAAVPDTVSGWRDWSKAATLVAKGAGHGHTSTH
jgi:carbon-monoxide dehydrogenase iron sulfur subunit